MPASIAAVATEVGARLLRLGKDFDGHRDGDAWTWSAAAQRTIACLPAPALIGDIQFDNAAAVLAVLAQVSDRLPVDDDAIRRGLTTVSLSGRFQSVAVDGVQWILDVAHNPAAARTLAGQLAGVRASDSFNDNPLATPRILAVCSILADKDIEGIATELRDSFDQWIVAGLSGPRAVPVDRLTQRLVAAGVSVAVLAENVDMACDEAAKLARRGDRVVVFGSFLTVAGAMGWLQRRGFSI